MIVSKNKILHVRYSNTLIDTLCPNCNIHKLEFTGGDHKLTSAEVDRLALPHYKCYFCRYTTIADIVKANIFNSEKDHDIWFKANGIKAKYKSHRNKGLI